MLEVMLLEGETLLKRLLIMRTRLCILLKRMGETGLRFMMLMFCSLVVRLSVDY